MTTSGTIKSVEGEKTAGGVAYKLVVARADPPPPEDVPFPELEEWVLALVKDNVGKPVQIVHDPETGEVVKVKVGA